MSIKNPKAKGNRNEHRTMSLLEAAGYQCTRSGASLGAWDVIGVGPYDIVLVQVKTNKWPLRKEVDALIAFPIPGGVTKLIYRWRDRQRRPDVWVLHRAPGTPWPQRGRYDSWGARAD